MSNLIIKGRNNPLLINITNFLVPEIPNFSLLDFDNITVKFGEEEYSLLNDPQVVRINEQGNQLQLYLGNTQETHSHFLSIVAFNSNFPSGYVLTNRCLGNLSIPKMCCDDLC